MLEKPDGDRQGSRGPVYHNWPTHFLHPLLLHLRVYFPSNTDFVGEFNLYRVTHVI